MSATHAQTDTVDLNKLKLFTLADDRRQAALTHLAQQNLEIADSALHVNADDFKQSNISNPNWQDVYGDSPCFVIHEIDFLIDGGDAVGMTHSDLRTLLLPLLDWTRPTYAIGRCVGNHNLSLIIDIAHNELLKRGYLTSSISVGEQDLSTGRLVLTVNAGKVQDIVLSNSDRVPYYIYGALAIKPNQTFRLLHLEQGLDTLKRTDPNATVSIVPSDYKSDSIVGADSDVNKPNYGFSDLHIDMSRKQSAVFGIDIDNSLSKDYGGYLIAANIRANNLMHLNDEWSLSANYPLVRLVDIVQDDLGVQVGKNRQVNYHTALSIPYGLYKFSVAHSHHHYKQFVEGFYAPLTYHGTSKTSTIGLSRLLYRNGSQKTEGYLKARHRRSSNYIDDVNIEVQNRRTTGYNIGIIHQRYFNQGGYLYVNADYKQGTGALKAKPAPEEYIHDALGRQLPSEGFARAPIWSLHASFQKPITLNNLDVKHATRSIETADRALMLPIEKQTVFSSDRKPILLNYTAKLQGQYAKQLPVSSDLFYLGGRDSIKGIKEGNYLSGEHGFSLAQELAWQLPLGTKQHAHSAALYASIDQGYVYGQNTISGQRYISAAAIGVRYSFQGAKEQLLYSNLTTRLNNLPVTAHLDVFVGKGMEVPEFMKKEVVVGVSAGAGF